MKLCQKCYGVVHGERCSCGPMVQFQPDRMRFRDYASIAAWALFGLPVGLGIGWAFLQVVSR